MDCDYSVSQLFTTSLATDLQRIINQVQRRQGVHDVPHKKATESFVLPFINSLSPAV